MRYVVYISAGSNLGRKKQNLSAGIDALGKSGVFRTVTLSPWYRTEPVDYRNQEWFVNCVVKGETGHEPCELLDTLKRIERTAGRRDGAVRFGPRVLDLDILLYDRRVICRPELVIPHPRLHKRHFVLKPFCDIDPDVTHPVFKRTMQHLLDRLDVTHQRIEPYSCDC